MTTTADIPSPAQRNPLAHRAVDPVFIDADPADPARVHERTGETEDGGCATDDWNNRPNLAVNVGETSGPGRGTSLRKRPRTGPFDRVYESSG